MASELGVARATIVETFERLVAEGLLESRVGAGTHVSPALNARVAPTDAPLDIGSVASAKLAKAIALAGQFGTRLVHQHQPFTTGMPAFDAFPMAQWFRLSSKHWRNARKPMLGYPEPHGELRLREAIATHLRVNRGIACHARQIFIVSGAQYAFQLIAEMLIDAGDRVWFENPGHIGARNCFMLAGAHMVAVPVDEAGLRVEQGRAVAPSFKLARHPVAAATAGREDEPGSALRAAPGRRGGRRVDHRGRLGRRFLRHRQAAAHAQGTGPRRAGDLRRQLQQIHFSCAAAGLHTGAAAAGSVFLHQPGGVLPGRSHAPANGARRVHRRGAFRDARPAHAPALRGTLRRARARGGHAPGALAGTGANAHRPAYLCPPEMPYHRP
ncbi:aminotransferase class I/II-fold pyridoxal phosphate-dependent enzyme [Verminephrobacter aporrectodeae subsp. tuberculatae]|nr:aminotransferase class I/II-fold pyridoxal phosphate-dependent enzyme [Verminephrobacter aporrectodeae subsp. tuberculatae]MCW8170993.1 aminotransferase class I/II-fold pyridoxal phosphate-dependent enzyme [Verminephrobacter aporrectodeae subsp. tuberculatae]